MTGDSQLSLKSCRAVVNTSAGPAKSSRSNFGWSAKRTSMGSSATAEVLFAAILTTV